jgi:hypothetical protein
LIPYDFPHFGHAGIVCGFGFAIPNNCFVFIYSYSKELPWPMGEDWTRDASAKS